MEQTFAIFNSFVIPVNNAFLFYSPLIGLSALINGKGILELREQLRPIQKKPGDSGSKLFELTQEILKSETTAPSRKTGKLNPDFLGIIPTRSCNGACNYCDFGADNAGGKKMSYKLAATAVDWYFNLSKRYKRDILEIHFFGGEPMLARDVIEVVVQRARLLVTGQEMVPYFEISTNGQFHTNDARFLGIYFNKVVLSLDGSKEVQKLHRPLKGNVSSFESAVETASIISNSQAELCIRCCVSRDTVSLMEEFTGWLCRNFRISAVNFEILNTSSLSNSKGLLPPDPFDFAIHFQKSREIAKMYGIDVVYSSDITLQPSVSSCPVGKDTAIVSPDGRIHNCYLPQWRWQEKGLDLDFGAIKSDYEVYIDKSKINAIRKMVESKSRCERCFCRWSCAGGCHVGNTFPNSSFQYNDFCKQTRIISACTLLTNLELESEKDRILTDIVALENLVNNPSDLMNDFNVL